MLCLTSVAEENPQMGGIVQTHVLEAAPTLKNMSRIFSKYCVETNESSDIKSYSTYLSHSKSIQQSMLSFGNSD